MWGIICKMWVNIISWWAPILFILNYYALRFLHFEYVPIKNITDRAAIKVLYFFLCLIRSTSGLLPTRSETILFNVNYVNFIDMNTNNAPVFSLIVEIPLYFTVINFFFMTCHLAIIIYTLHVIKHVRVFETL